MVKVAVVGCTHGELDALYARIDDFNASKQLPDDRIRLLLCCGDFESLRNAIDLACKACPPKYRHMNSFHAYYHGAKRASVLTIFIGGNHEASNYLQELRYGGWVAPNIFYLGASGVVHVAGLRIAGISGIYHAKHYRSGQYETAPYTKKTIDSVYCVREYQVHQLSHLTPSVLAREKPSLDVFLSHDWPTHIENHGDIDALLRERPDFQKSIGDNRFGNPGSEYLLHALQPTRWLAGHMHIRFEATVPHPSLTLNAADQDSPHATTHFLALSKCKPNEACMEVLDLVPGSQTTTNDELLRVMMDVEWLAILRATHHLASHSRQPVDLPEEKMGITADDIAWVEKRLDEVHTASSVDNDKVRGEWPTEFVMMAPPWDGASDETMPKTSRESVLGNPQTDSFLIFLELPHVVTTPYAPVE
uniref:Lariat debranching enzyme C-terminal domain-containing protein n=1 Tax=Globisporangium ultimum (strain ATCC 200006 / CBS 805.95 / DAOM BR144) TaxID=431595 RepID=K3W792_GLOUD